SALRERMCVEILFSVFICQWHVCRPALTLNLIMYSRVGSVCVCVCVWVCVCVCESAGGWVCSGCDLVCVFDVLYVCLLVGRSVGLVLCVCVCGLVFGGLGVCVCVCVCRL